MKGNEIRRSGRERKFAEDDIIVSKTDLTGRIRYANRVFLDIAGYEEREVIGRPHNMIRHPNMPSCIFHLLWEIIQRDEEIFAYVLNMAKNGDHYWVFAHVTPSYSTETGERNGYHSFTGRGPNRYGSWQSEELPSTAAVCIFGGLFEFRTS